MSWDETWTSTQQQSSAINNWADIYAKIKQLLKVNSSDNGVLMARSLVCGSINASFTRIVGSDENSNAVQSSISSSIQTGTSGLNILSSNLISQSSSDEGNKSALYIGLFVGIGGGIIGKSFII
jgi:hypothetical protein